LKWYHKALYRLSNAILSTEVRKQMMLMGRLTIPKNVDDPYWRIFAHGRFNDRRGHAKKHTECYEERSSEWHVNTQAIDGE
jgi:hypothetical protein